MTVYKNHQYSNPDFFKKVKDNSQLARDIMDYYDYYTDDVNSDFLRYDENYNLHKGRWPNIENMHSNSVNFNIGRENIILGGGKIRHWPILNRATEYLAGEIILRPFIPLIRDYSSRARNFRERKRLEVVVDYLKEKFVNPKLEEITSQVMSGVNQEQYLQMPIEQKQQLQADIQRKAAEQSPEEIMAYLEKIRTPDEQLFSQIFDAAMAEVSLKDKFDLGGEHAIVTGEEYYRVTTRNMEPVVDVLKPKYLDWSGSDSVTNVEDGEFARYTDYLTLQDIVGKYGLDLKISTIKDVIDWHSGIPGNYSNKGIESIDHAVARFLADNPHIDDNIDPRTLEGQQDLRDVYKLAGYLRRNGFGIKETYITWRWSRPIKLVTREVNGKRETFIQDEHYKINKFKGDLNVEKRLIEQTWHGVKLGENDDVYLNVEPLPFQYDNIRNPFKPKLSIYGTKYNTVHNEVKNSSFVDQAKPWQYKYNVLMKRKEEFEATDIGKVVFGSMNLKPDSYTWGEWYKSIFVGKFAPISSHFEGLNQMDKKPFYVEDLSNVRDIQAFIQQLEYVEQKIYSSMSFNPAKFGQIGQYSNTTTTRAALQGADKQLIKFHDTHRKVKQAVSRALLNAALYAYRDNEYKKDIILDDFTRAHFEKNIDNLNSSEYEISVVDDFQQSEKLEQMRQLALTMLQNGGKARDIAAIVNANSMGEIEDILEESDKNKEKQEELQFRRQQELIKQQQQLEQRKIQLQQQFESMENERERQAKLQMAELSAQTMERSNDINENMISDSLEKAMMEIASKERIAAMNNDTKLKSKLIDSESKLKEPAT